METELINRGYRCKDRKKFDEDCERDSKGVKWKNPIRFTYVRGEFRVLTESSDRPFWTVQKMSSGHVMWFVDFPLDVNIDAIFAFIDAA
jgi:hypothetical protein